MAEDSAYYVERARYAVVYPGLVVVPIALRTVLRPELGPALPLRTALLGGAVFAFPGGDTWTEQAAPAAEDGHATPSSSHFDRDAPERKGSTVINAIMLFGVGLFVPAGVAVVVAVAVR